MKLPVLVYKFNTNALSNFSLHIIYYFAMLFTWSPASLIYLTILFTWSPAVHTKLYLCLKAMLLGFFKSDAAPVLDCTILEDPTIILKSLSIIA